MKTLKSKQAKYFTMEPNECPITGFIMYGNGGMYTEGEKKKKRDKYYADKAKKEAA